MRKTIGTILFITMIILLGSCAGIYLLIYFTG